MYVSNNYQNGIRMCYLIQMTTFSINGFIYDYITVRCHFGKISNDFNSLEPVHHLTLIFAISG